MNQINSQLQLGGQISGFLNPDAVVYALGLQKGDSVADFGAGIGRYSIPIAKQVAPTGKVYAYDIQEMVLSRINTEAKQLGIAEEVIHAIVADIEKEQFTELVDESVDLVLIANVLFLLSNKEVPIKEAQRILKPNGRLVVIDWIDSFGGIGPPKHMIVNKEKIIELASGIGFELTEQLPDTNHHFITIFRKK